MKLRKLTIHNIASIADACIEFDKKPLQDEAVFLICGDTGSGKTTILDTICLALYNSTPRLSMVAGKESYTDVNGEQITLVNPNQYLRKGAWEASVTLSFESGGKEWQASWSTHRANKKPDGKFQGIKWELTDLETGVSTKGTDAARITGLSFDEFRRTTMLAQGDFTAFLKSKDDEKSAILEKITGSGIYRRIGKKISERFKEANNTYTLVLERINTLKSTILEEDAIKRYKEEIITLSEKIQVTEAEKGTLSRILSAFEEKGRLAREISSFEASLAEAGSEYSRLMGGLEHARKTLSDRERQLSDLQSYINRNSIYADMYLNSTVIIENLKGIINDRTRLDYLRQEKSELTSSHELRNKELRQRLVEEADIVKACYDQEEKVRVLAHKKSELNPERLRRQKDDIEAISRLKENAKKNADELETLEDKLGIEKKAIESTRKETENAVTSYMEISVIHDRLKESNEQWAKDARASLSVGEGCPVCGQRIATQEYLDSISDEHFESLLKPVRESLAEKAALLEQARKALMEKEAGIRLLEEQIKIGRTNMETALRAIEKAVMEAGNPDCSKEKHEQICAALEKAEATSRELDIETTRLNTLNKERFRLQVLSSNAKLAEQEVAGKITVNENSYTETENHLLTCLSSARKSIAWVNWEDDWNRDRKAFIDRLAKEAAAYREGISHMESLSQNVMNIRNGLQGIIQEYKDTVATMPSLSSLPTGTIEKVDRLEACWSTLRAGIITAEKGLREATERMAGLDQITEDRNKEDLDKEIALLTEQISAAHQTIGSHSKTLKDNDDAIRKHLKDLKDLEAATAERDQWKALNDIFGKKDGEYFQKVAQGFIMNDILNRANHYLKDMTGRYILESQRGSLNIIIRDMEQGGIPRSTSTISGGESFILSLALALGLSSLGNGRISNDILFIDEGFGSLSEEFLNTVIETLQRLNEKSGKRVGIISHVEQLRNRIAAKIAVSKINQTTSKVEVTVENRD